MLVRDKKRLVHLGAWSGAVLAGSILVMGPASAHAQFLGSAPEEGAALEMVPTSMVLEYSENISPEFVQASVSGVGEEPQGAAVSVEGTTVSVNLGEGTSAPGEWEITTRVVSADGHPMENTTRFTVVASPESPSVVAAPVVLAVAETPTQETPEALETPEKITGDALAAGEESPLEKSAQEEGTSTLVIAAGSAVGLGLLLLGAGLFAHQRKVRTRGKRPGDATAE